MKTIFQLLEEQAALYGDRTFLSCNGKEISFQSCHDMAERVAGNLVLRGIGRNDKVVLLLDNCLEFLYCFFGLGRIGAIMVPVNPTLALEELIFIVEDSDATAVVLTKALAPAWPKLQAAVPALKHCFVTASEEPIENMELFAHLLEPLDAENTVAAAEAQDDASIIYTSGTTGIPKGVVLTHSNYFWDTLATSRSNTMFPEDRILCLLPLFHVNAQVVSILIPLLRGAQVFLMTGRFGPFSILPAIERHKISIMSAVPTIYGIMCRIASTEAYNVNSMRYFVSGAAPMPEEIYNATQRLFKKPLVMGYGLTEATCASAVADHEDPIRWNSVGPPLRYTQIRIVDEAMKDLPVGEVGEILIYGPTVMKEYYKNPEATEEVLKEGWLRTGDLGHLDAEGYLYIVDRVKDMIIRGGLNVYPAQVEQVIARIPGVEEVAVIGIAEVTWGQEVVAVIKPTADAPAPLTEKDIHSFCREHLAQYKRPRYIRFVTEMPKTATGKIRKNVLAEQFKDIGRHNPPDTSL